MNRSVIFAAFALVMSGCWKSATTERLDSTSESTAAATAESDAAAEERIRKLSKLAPPPPRKFDSPEDEMAYWEDEYIQAAVRKQESRDKESLERAFEKLSQSDQAAILRIRSWLPHKRITEMGNVEDDLRIISSHPEQFDIALACRRMLEYADDSGARKILKNLGVERPKAIVSFRIDYGQLLPTVQQMVWGITEKLKTTGYASLTESERALFHARPGLFPTFFP